MGALLALIPTKDWFIGAAFAVLALLGWHFYDKYRDAVNYAVTVKAESKAALEAANQKIADLTKQYSDDLKANEAKYESELKSAAVQRAGDAERLRQLSASRQIDSVLHGFAGTAAEADAWAGRLGALESISAGLADALRQDDASLAECWRDRDAVTGK